MKILIIGSGLFGSVFASEAAKKGNNVKILEKRNHIAGNIYTKEVEGIQMHQYGAHIFHTSNKEVWDYINQFAEFNRYTNSPIANYKGEIYNLPFNMNTFNNNTLFKSDKNDSNSYNVDDKYEEQKDITKEFETCKQ